MDKALPEAGDFEEIVHLYKQFATEKMQDGEMFKRIENPRPVQEPKTNFFMRAAKIFVTKPLIPFRTDILMLGIGPIGPSGKTIILGGNTILLGGGGNRQVQTYEVKWQSRGSNLSGTFQSGLTYSEADALITTLSGKPCYECCDIWKEKQN